jgi:hypothetical protein
LNISKDFKREKRGARAEAEREREEREARLKQRYLNSICNGIPLEFEEDSF